jgi:glutathione S-transferase
LVAVQYQKWAGLVPQGMNHLNYVPIVRNLDRVNHTLDWLEIRIVGEGFFGAKMSLQDVILACLILWTESRGPIEWRGRPRIESVVKKLSERQSFVATVPVPLQH